MDILKEIIDALQSEEQIILATIISTNGSTPASALSKMLVMDGGKKWLGTVGGGCLEGDVLQEAITMVWHRYRENSHLRIERNKSRSRTYLRRKSRRSYRTFFKEHLPLFREMKRARDNGDDCIQLTYLAKDGKVAGKQCLNMNRDWSRWSGGRIGWNDNEG